MEEECSDFVDLPAAPPRRSLPSLTGVSVDYSKGGGGGVTRRWRRGFGEPGNLGEVFHGKVAGDTGVQCVRKPHTGNMGPWASALGVPETDLWHGPGTPIPTSLLYA